MAGYRAFAYGEWSQLRTLVVDGEVGAGTAARVLGLPIASCQRVARLCGWENNFAPVDGQGEVLRRVCTRCKQEKPLLLFSRSRKGVHGFGVWCLMCTRETTRAFRARVGNTRTQPGLRGTGAYRTMTSEQRRICDKNWGVDPDLPYP